MIMVKTQPWHLRELMKDPVTAPIRSFMTEERINHLVKSPHTVTGMVGMQPVACAGVTEYWPGRGELWAIMPRSTGPHMLALTRLARKYIAGLSIRRIEATVDCDFDAGHRWMKLLGIEKEASPLKAFSIEGKDVSLYAKVRG